MSRISVHNLVKTDLWILVAQTLAMKLQVLAIPGNSLVIELFMLEDALLTLSGFVLEEKTIRIEPLVTSLAEWEPIQ